METKQEAQRRRYRKWYLANLEVNREKARIKAAKWREENPDKVKAVRKKNYDAHRQKNNARTLQWKKDHPEEVKVHKAKYVVAHHSEVIARQKRWHQAHPGLYKEKSAEWQRVNSGVVNEKTKRYYATKRKAVPIWFDKTRVVTLYKQAAIWGMDVDHIIPLQNPIVCGLHTWENLQLLHHSVNASKSNITWPDMP